jgi:hypothetical protein
MVKEYTIDVGGVAHTVLLDEADAKARGLTGGKSQTPETKQADPPANKARTGPDK